MKRSHMKKKITLGECKSKLAWLWLIMFGIILSLLIAQNIVGKYYYKSMIKDQYNEWQVISNNDAVQAWEWFVPLVIPALSLIVAAWRFDIWRKKTKRNRKKAIKPGEFRFFWGLSFLYLLTLSSVILLHPFSQLSQLELMKQSQVWLMPFQGVIITSLGGFFVIRGEIWESIKKFLGI